LTPDRSSIGAVRRATAADTAALAALLPGLAPLSASDHRALFVIDGDDGAMAAIDLLQAGDHIGVEHLVAAKSHDGRTLLAFAEVAARGVGMREVRLRPGAVPDELAAALGYRAGAKRVRNGPWQRANDYLEAVGVPLWRDGTAPLTQTLYFRGVWAAVALLAGLGSVSAAVFSGRAVTWIHIAVPAVLCALAALFASWQIGLLAMAARRGGSRLVFSATAAAAAAAIVAVGALVYDRALPSLAEMWAIYSGDTALNDLTVSVSPDGRTLHVEGSYGVGSEEAVRRALDQNRGIREVVLAGPGGRVSVGFDIYRMIQQRKLATRVEAGCASACTIAFLGGVERSISPGGRLGFHRASFPGMGESDMYESNRDLRRFLIYGARLTPEFAERVFDTPPNSIWVPTPQELLAGRVINRVNP
jgi:hypothetical protein